MLERLLLVVPLATAGVPSAGSAESEKVDRIVGRLVKPDGPGCAVLVVKAGEVLHSKGYGFANVENRVPIDSKTAFDLASVSKQFTAFGMLVLVEQGKVALEDDVRKHVPELPVWSEARPIRIGDLLTQMTGLPDYVGLHSQFGKPDESMVNTDIAALMAKQKLEFPTGTKWKYSNSNSCLAALVIERVSGKSFARFIGDEVFEPLGMTGSAVFDRWNMVVPRRAYGYSREGDQLVTVHSDLTTTGDGSIWCSLEDFVKWDAELREPTLVSAERVDVAMTSSRLDDGSETGYGMGWFASRDGDEPVAQHSGGWAGFWSHHLRYRDTELTVVVLANIEDGSIRPSQLSHQVADVFRKQ